jgi:NAD(P)-dependent dehydrogenase (short-subunit alcohol dehydrogenase family)
MFRLLNDSEEKRAAAASLHAMKRVATAEEIVDAIVFLSSGESSFLTGATFALDGGVSLT